MSSLDDLAQRAQTISRGERRDRREGLLEGPPTRASRGERCEIRSYKSRVMQRDL